VRTYDLRVQAPLLSIVIPTIGRPTLKTTLRSIRRQNRGDIEIIVVSDGSRPSAERIARMTGATFIEGPRTQSWGNAQRMIGIKAAAGRYLMFIDDDDKHRRGAFNQIRAAIAATPDRIIVFRMTREGEILWWERVVKHTNQGTPQLLVPNVPGRLGSWLTQDRYESDFDFLTECVALQGEPIWNEAIIADCPPRIMWVRERLILRNRARWILAWLKKRLRMYVRNSRRAAPSMRSRSKLRLALAAAMGSRLEPQMSPLALFGTVRARLRPMRYRMARRTQIGRKVRFGRGVRIVGRASIGDGAEIGSNTWIVGATAEAVVVIEPNTFIASQCIIAARERVHIGSETMIAEMVTIRDHDHDPDYPPKSGRTLSAPITIGARVWIGTKATVARGVTVGDDAVVGANAVVTADVEASSIVAGVPAKLIRRKAAYRPPG
jgi:acetyltransferase-like isoleucine patch superfamily enzyme